MDLEKKVREANIPQNDVDCKTCYGNRTDLKRMSSDEIYIEIDEYNRRNI